MEGERKREMRERLLREMEESREALFDREKWFSLSYAIDDRELDPHEARAALNRVKKFHALSKERKIDPEAVRNAILFVHALITIANIKKQEHEMRRAYERATEWEVIVKRATKHLEMLGELVAERR